MLLKWGENDDNPFSCFRAGHPRGGRQLATARTSSPSSTRRTVDTSGSPKCS